MLVGDEERCETQKKKKPGGWKAIAYILGNETFERLGTYGLFANFMVYLTSELHLDHVSATTIMNICFGFTNFGPLFGAFVSDAYASRFNTIAFASSSPFWVLNKAALIIEDELNPDGSRKNKWRLSSNKQVEEVKCLASTFPIWVTGILSFISIPQQMTWTVSQASTMDLHLGSKFQIPKGSILVMSYLTVCFFVPLYDRFLVPALRKMTHLEGGIILLQRIGIGMVFSILSMVVSGLIETSRRSGSANSLSVSWLAPQLIQVGLFEAMSIIGQIEFFNKQFPEHMKSIANSVVFCSLGIASYLNGLLVTVVHYGTRRRRDLLANDLNVGRLDYFYYLISGFLGLNLVMFIWVARRYECKETFKVYNDDDAGFDVELRTGKV